jgi:AraC-like DNA-binding protein
MYQLLSPGEKLRPHVECFWQSEFEVLGTEVYEELFNAQCVPNLIFNLDEHYLVNDEVVGDAVVHGFNSKPILYKHHQKNKLFGIRFHPLGLNVFTKVSLLAMNDQIVPAQEVFGAYIYDWQEELALAHDVQQRVDISERYLMMLLDEKLLQTQIQTALLWNALERQVDNGERMDGLAAKLHLTHRSLDRQMKGRLGLAPKKLSRILRFNKAFAAMHSPGNKVSSCDFHQFGYYDQSHFIKEFQTFVQLSPEAYKASAFFVHNLQSQH